MYVERAVVFLYIQFYSHSFTCSVVSLIGFNDFIPHFICSAVKLKKNESHILEFLMEYITRMLFSSRKWKFNVKSDEEEEKNNKN